MPTRYDYVFVGIFLILTILAYFILNPFLTAILGSFILAYVFYPVYSKMRRFIRNETIMALIVSFLIVLLFTLPLMFVANSLVHEARVNYLFIKDFISSGKFMGGEECTDPSSACALQNLIASYASNSQVQYYATDFFAKAADFLISFAGRLIFSIPAYLLNFFIMLFLVYYLLKEGEVLIYRLKVLLPVTDEYAENIYNTIKQTTFAVVYGHVIVAAGQATIGGLAFWIFGVPSPILWSFVMFFLALIPLMGTPLVWGPAVIFKFASNEPVSAIGILIVGIFISTADNFIKPKLIAEKAGKVHPAAILLGVLGGMLLFGIVGMFIGPVILSLLMTFIKIYEDDKIEAKG